MLTTRKKGEDGRGAIAALLSEKKFGRVVDVSGAGRVLGAFEPNSLGNQLSLFPPVTAVLSVVVMLFVLWLGSWSCVCPLVRGHNSHPHTHTSISLHPTQHRPTTPNYPQKNP